MTNTTNSLLLSQTKYALDILIRVQMKDCQPMPTPMTKKNKDSSAQTHTLFSHLLEHCYSAKLSLQCQLCLSVMELYAFFTLIGQDALRLAAPLPISAPLLTTIASLGVQKNKVQYQDPTLKLNIGLWPMLLLN